MEFHILLFLRFLRLLRFLGFWNYDFCDFFTSEIPGDALATPQRSLFSYPRLLPNPATQPCYPTLPPNPSTQPFHPTLLPNPATQPFYPSLLPNRSTQRSYPTLLPNHPTQPFYPTLPLQCLDFGDPGGVPWRAKMGPPAIASNSSIREAHNFGLFIFLV